MTRKSKQNVNKAQLFLEQSEKMMGTLGELGAQVEKSATRAEVARDGAEVALHKNVQLSVSFNFAMKPSESRLTFIIFLMFMLGCSAETSREYSASSR